MQDRRFAQKSAQVQKLCIRKLWSDSRGQVKVHIPSHPTDDLRKETGQTSNPVVSSYRTAVKTYSTNTILGGIKVLKLHEINLQQWMDSTDTISYNNHVSQQIQQHWDDKLILLKV